MTRHFILSVTARTALVLSVSLAAQTAVQAQGRQQAGGPPPSAQAAAPIDLTGYWVSIVTLDWNYRMVTPRPGDYSDVPLTAAGIKVMDAWDPAKDEAAGDQCKSYGAPAIMRVPEHLHITWQDDQAMKLATDAGEQTRVFHFVESDAAQGPRTWQGYSFAVWQIQRRSIDTGGGRTDRAGAPVWGDLKVTTSDLKAGYLRKNGIPYSDDAQLVEYYDLLPQGDGNQMLVVTSSVTDPLYLTKTFIVNSNFKKLSSDAGWEPSACSARW
jgi:hypothetical protein